MSILKKGCFELSGHVKCQSCDNIFPKEFADKCLGWYRAKEEYEINELIESFGINWKDYDKKGQWYLWKNDFICPECSKRLIDSGEAKIVTSYHEYYTTQPYEELPEKEKQYATPHKTLSGSNVKIPYNILVKVYKKKKK